MKKIIILNVVIVLLFTSSIASVNAFNVGRATAGEEIEGVHILPSYWNWKDMNGVDWTTPAKNQGRCPVCDVFATIGALESVIKIREGCADFNPDLSEQYVVSCVIDILNHSNSHNYFEKMNGTVSEDCFPYKASFFVPCSKKSSDWKKYFVPSSSVNWTMGATKEFIKNKLIEHGPIILWIQCLGVFWNWRPSIGGYLGRWGRNHNDPDDYFSGKLPKIMNGNHAVLLVGWKDDSSIKNGGYWICKNCWGTNWGYDGFFNLEYDNLGSNSGNIAWIDYNPDDFNWPPIGKPTLNGPTHMESNVEYEFNFSSIDPERDSVYYKFSWGDGSESDWLWPFESGSIVTAKHTWGAEGSYNVRIKARNENGPESNWMPENQIKRSR
jgi:hypothetical protein